MPFLRLPQHTKSMAHEINRKMNLHCTLNLRFVHQNGSAVDPKNTSINKDKLSIHSARDGMKERAFYKALLPSLQL